MRHKITKQSILDATLLVASRKGIHQFTLQDIATELGIKTPSLYNHIQGIDDLYEFLAIDSIEMLTSEITNEIIGFAKRDALIRIANAYLSFSMKQPIRIQAIEHPSLVSFEKLNVKKEELVQRIAQVLSPYDLGEVNTVHCIRILRSYLYGFSILNTQSLFQLHVDVQESFTLGLYAILDGMKL